MPRILLVDDDADFAECLREKLQEEGHDVEWIDLPDEGLKRLDTGPSFDLILLDNRMPRMSGLEFLAALKKGERSLPVILMTSAHNDRTVIQAINLGAFGYVIKPEGGADVLRELRDLIAEVMETIPPVPPVPIPKGAPEPEDDSAIVGRSRAVIDLLIRTGRVAEMDETVLILGETGTGKDLVARAIHTNSRRKNKPFVVMNCTALNENLLDDELFGHEAGAYTGADKLRKGRFEHAQGGSLFLDEVGDMPLTLQAKLLRVLENREVVRVGSNDPIKVDVRVLAATHRDIPALVREGKFRQDLFYRLEGMTIHLPPLRERKEDIELLARCFLSRIFGGAPAARLGPPALAKLRNYPWPGNIRQLQKVLCRAAGVCRGAEIGPDDIDFGDMNNPSPCTSTPQATDGTTDDPIAALRSFIVWGWQTHDADLWPRLQEQMELELLRFALEQPGLSQVQLARRLGIARNTLRARLEQFKLNAPPLES